MLMSISTESKSETDAKARTGKIIAVCYSSELINDVGKERRGEGHITRWGIPGDRHYGKTRYSQSKRRIVPNNRPITVVGVEAEHDACERLGVPMIPPGGIGENLLVEGLGDLGDLQPGDELHALGADGQTNVILRVGKQNEPCSNLQVYHKLMTKEMYGKRGVICTVLQEGHVREGDTVWLVRSK
jgi:hypothetical protein